MEVFNYLLAKIVNWIDQLFKWGDAYSRSYSGWVVFAVILWIFSKSTDLKLKGDFIGGKQKRVNKNINKETK